MGFTPKTKTVLLTFDEGHDFHGLEVRTRVPDIARIASLIELREYVGADPDTFDEAAVVTLVALLGRAADIFAEHLVSWNVETADDPPTPVPATREGLATQPDEFMLNLVAEWMTATMGVREELGKGSTSGLRSPEESLPMVALSSSRAS